MKFYLPGGEIKRESEIGKTAIQPEPAQTADLSISGSRLISSLCTLVFVKSQELSNSEEIPSERPYISNFHLQGDPEGLGPGLG